MHECTSLVPTQLPEWAAKTTLISYPPAAEMLRHPRVIDPSMMQPYPGVLVPGPKGLGVQPYSTSPGGQKQQPMKNFTPQQQGGNLSGMPMMVRTEG